MSIVEDEEPHNSRLLNHGQQTKSVELVAVAEAANCGDLFLAVVVSAAAVSAEGFGSHATQLLLAVVVSVEEFCSRATQLSLVAEVLAVVSNSGLWKQEDR